MTRLLRGVGANLYAQAVTVVLQIAAVPGFLHAWGEARFGTWVVILAWTSILSLADLGVMVASGNAMTMALAAGNPVLARRLIWHTLQWVTAVAVLLLAVLAMVVPFLPYAIGSAEDPDLHNTILVLAAVTLAGLPLGTFELGFRADGRYAAGVARTSTVRLIETAAALSAALLGSSLLGAAEAMLAVRLVGLIVVAMALRRRARWLLGSIAPGGWRELAGLARSAVAAGMVPTGLLLGIQGATVAASAVVTTSAVAAFVAARTLTRALVQALGLVNHALMPELAMAVGACDNRRALALLRLNLIAAAGLLLPGWVALVVFGPRLMQLWTGGRLHPDPVFFAAMASAACLHGAWLSASNLLLAVNRQGEYAFWLLALAAMSCLLTVVLGRVWGLPGVAAASLLGEAAMVAIVLPRQLRAAFGSAAVDLAGVRS